MSYRGIPSYKVCKTVYEFFDWCHVIYGFCHSVLCLSVCLSVFSLCQLLLLLPRSFIGSVFVQLHLAKMSQTGIIGYYYYYF